MATSWLDLMGDDSNISMASMASMASLECENKSRVDPEFDHSQQGVNLMFKKNIKIISEDSQSRKRTFKSIKTSADENANCLPPKAKQRTNDKGHWMKRKGLLFLLCFFDVFSIRTQMFAKMEAVHEILAVF